MQGTMIDLHVHTTYGSLDSALRPHELVQTAPRIGLRGAAVTEHVTTWPHDLVERLGAEEGTLIAPCREVETDMGHILVLGVSHKVRYNGHATGVRATVDSLLAPAGTALPGSAAELRRIVRDEGGMLILAHPFRYFRSPRNLLFGDRPQAAHLPPEQLAEHPVFSLVDEIEALNGDSTLEENRLALAVARVLGMRGTGGSDAHARHELGRCVTVFERPVTSMAGLLRELAHGRTSLARRIWQPGIRVDGFQPWGEED
jgi:predicted metal-dependent phosphoesterase TrpH